MAMVSNIGMGGAGRDLVLMAMVSNIGMRGAGRDLVLMPMVSNIGMGGGEQGAGRDQGIFPTPHPYPTPQYNSILCIIIIHMDILRGQ